ncbi:MAG: DNA polymerase III subunit beta [Chloroflexi bacterium HGW-Chloroflexi-10]|jgi:DNA polymerase-3 subunit beta|nr:MAG: DNA polymerase III subunit beta [Chloroflexi bacterium HGW-Chloroflexi-10]
MKASVSQQELAHGLSMVSRAVSPRSTLPVLANILIATDEGRLRLSATNLELGISCWIPARVDEEGAVTIPSRTISDLVNALPNDRVEMTLNERTQTINVRCGTNSTDIKGIDAQEYPPMPIPDLSEGVALNVSDFKEMIQQVAFAASTDEARPVLQGVLTQIEGNLISMAATDGFRISVRKNSLSNPTNQPLSIIIPARAMNELARIATNGDETITMNVPAGRGQVIFHLKDAELVSQLIEGNFPPFEAIIPRSSKTHTIISTGGFHKACRQAEIIARDGNNIVRLHIQPQPGGPGVVEISAQSEETGTSEVQLDATIDGEGLLIAFNVRYLREVLDVVKTPNIALETNANNTPAIFKPIGEEGFIHVIMPMHLG